MPCKNLLRINRMNVDSCNIAPIISSDGISISIAMCKIEDVKDCPKKKNPGDVTPHCWRY